MLPKRSLIRIVRIAESIEIDPTGKKAGRGAYLHDRRSCWERGLKGPLENALKVEFTAADRELLLAFMSSLPEEEPDRPAEDEPAKIDGRSLNA